MREIKNWKTIGPIDCDNVIDLLIKNNIKISDWIQDIFQRLEKTVLLKDKLDLVRVSLADLGFDGPTRLKDFYAAAKQRGLKCLTPQQALLVRLEYKEQPIKEWLRIAIEMNEMIDSDDVPHLPKMGHALSNLYIETYWAWPDAIFHPHNEFVMRR